MAPRIIAVRVSLLVVEAIVVKWNRKGAFGFAGVLCVIISEFFSMYEFRAANAQSWLILPATLPDLCALCYVGLKLDFDDIGEIETVLSARYALYK